MWHDREQITKNLIEMLKIGMKQGILQERKKAIEAGYGYHTTDPKTGINEFVYGPIPEGKETEHDNE